MRERDPGSTALIRYAELGRLLSDLPAGTSDADARTALVDTLHAWTERLDVSGLSAFGMRKADIPAVVADSPGSSMRTNPIALSNDELTSILTSAR